MQRLNNYTLSAIIVLLLVSCNKSMSDEEIAHSIYMEAIFDSTSYKNLAHLTKFIGGRIACSPEAIEAAYFTKAVMDDMNLDTVFMQEIMVRNWDPGRENADIITKSFGIENVNVCALGLGVGTDSLGVSGSVVEIKSKEELDLFGVEKIKGKIVFFNQVTDSTLENTFHAYGQAAWQRTQGPSLAYKYGAIGAVIRSLNTAIDTFPHTGVTKHDDENPAVPAVAISTYHAELLHKRLIVDPTLKFHLVNTCINKPDTISYNVIGQLSGREFPEKYIVVGGHLDSWYNSQGAHDDGAGCMQAIDVLRIFQELNIKPRHSIRAVMFMDEEISQRGGKAYANCAKENNEVHIAAIESDRGATQPVGFTIDASDEVIARIQSWKPIFEKYGMTMIEKGGGGVDIAPLKNQGVPLIGYVPEDEHYFEWHHSANDTFEQINLKEMQAGTAAISILVYLIDKYGLSTN